MNISEAFLYLGAGLIAVGVIVLTLGVLLHLVGQ